MEVRCDRCQTEYDFDDALVSERGTTVKCTTCGYQFRIYRPKNIPAAPERWLVRTQSAQDLVYTSLRDLQRAIARGQVGRDDTLVREGMEPRPLSSIAELDPFFPQMRPPTVSRVPSDPPRLRHPTPKGMGLGVANLFRDSEDSPTKRIVSSPPPPVSPEEEPGEIDDELTVPKMELSDFQPPKPPVAEVPKVRSREDSSAGADDNFKRPTDVLKGRSPSQIVEVPNQVVIRDVDELSLTPTPSDIMRSSYTSDEITGPRFIASSPKRSSAMRWLVAVVVLGGIAVVGATVGRSYLARGVQPVVSASPSDARVMELLRSGQRQFSDGDLEGAKESFDKASVLADNDPKVMVELARLANARADQSWLRLRILPPDAGDSVASAKRELEDRASRAQQAADRAAMALPGDAEAARVRIDAYRLMGDLSLARRLVPQVSQRASEPETAYVLAALEMGESQPNWATVVDRLRNAASAEQNLGRARAALIVAYASSGQLDLANQELVVLSKLTRRHPLLSEITAYLSRGGKAADAGPISSAIPASSATAVAVGASAGGDPSESGASYQDLLRRAHDAHKAGDTAKAESLYRAVLAKNPQDTEALGGLGDIARERGDKSASLRYYQEVTRQNPGYLPALIGMADAKWDSGDKAGAVALYRQIVDRVGGQGPYADKARQRISASQSSGGAAGATTSAPTVTSSPAPTSSGSKPATPAGVDTSDLPGWKP